MKMNMQVIEIDGDDYADISISVEDSDDTIGFSADMSDEGVYSKFTVSEAVAVRAALDLAIAVAEANIAAA